MRSHSETKDEEQNIQEQLWLRRLKLDVLRWLRRRDEDNHPSGGRTVHAERREPHTETKQHLEHDHAHCGDGDDYEKSWWPQEFVMRVNSKWNAPGPGPELPPDGVGLQGELGL